MHNVGDHILRQLSQSLFTTHLIAGLRGGLAELRPDKEKTTTQKPVSTRVEEQVGHFGRCA